MKLRTLVPTLVLLALGVWLLAPSDPTPGPARPADAETRPPAGTEPEAPRETSLAGPAEIVPAARAAVTRPALPPDTLRIRVVDARGLPVAGAQAGIRRRKYFEETPADGGTHLNGGGYWWNPTDRRFAYTDAEGIAQVTTDKPDTWVAGALRLPELGTAYSEPIELAAGESAAVTLPLPTLVPEEVVHGRVLGLDGAPAERARVGLMHRRFGRWLTWWRTTDREGRFAFQSSAPLHRGELRASAEGLYSEPLEGVTRGAGPIELQLLENAPFTLEITDSEGAHVRCTAWLRGNRWLRSSGRTCDGVETWNHPHLPFTVSIGTYEFENVTLGPFGADESPGALRVVLQPRSSLRGRVESGGRPVAKASVYLDSVEPSPESAATESDYELFERSRSTPSTRTDEDGAFAMRRPSDGRYRFRAWHADLGQGIGPVFEVAAAAPSFAHVIELDRPPGSIRGRVLVPAGEDPADLALSTSRRGGYTLVRSDGTFWLRELQPGRHWIHPYDGSWLREFGSSSDEWISVSHGPDKPPAWMPVSYGTSVQVPSGETLEIVLDYASPPRCELSGHLRFGAPKRVRTTWEDAGFDATLDRGAGTQPVSECDLDATGDFVLGAREPGDYRLRLEVPLENGTKLVAVDRLTLAAGLNQWTLQPEAGRLRLLPSKDPDALSVDGVFTRWRDGAELEVMLYESLADPDDGSAFFPLLPAGEVELFRSSGTFDTVTIAPERTLEYRLPAASGERD